MSKFVEKYNYSCVVSLRDISLYPGRFCPQELTQSSGWLQRADSPRRVERSNPSLLLQLPEFFLHFSDWGFHLCVWYSGVKGHPAKIKISRINQLLVNTEHLLWAQVIPGHWYQESHSLAAALVVTNTCQIAVSETKESTELCWSRWCQLKVSG